MGNNEEDPREQITMLMRGKGGIAFTIATLVLAAVLIVMMVAGL